jgi:hypothetical protein
MHHHIREATWRGIYRNTFPSGVEPLRNLRSEAVSIRQHSLPKFAYGAGLTEDGSGGASPALADQVDASIAARVDPTEALRCE